MHTPLQQYQAIHAQMPKRDDNVPPPNAAVYPQKEPKEEVKAPLEEEGRVLPGFYYDPVKKKYFSSKNQHWKQEPAFDKPLTKGKIDFPTVVSEDSFVLRELDAELRLEIQMHAAKRKSQVNIKELRDLYEALYYRESLPSQSILAEPCKVLIPKTRYVRAYRLANRAIILSHEPASFKIDVNVLETGANRPKKLVVLAAAPNETFPKGSILLLKMKEEADHIVVLWVSYGNKVKPIVMPFPQEIAATSDCLQAGFDNIAQFQVCKKGQYIIVLKETMSHLAVAKYFINIQNRRITFGSTIFLNLHPYSVRFYKQKHELDWLLAATTSQKLVGYHFKLTQTDRTHLFFKEEFSFLLPDLMDLKIVSGSHNSMEILLLFGQESPSPIVLARISRAEDSGLFKLELHTAINDQISSRLPRVQPKGYRCHRDRGRAFLILQIEERESWSLAISRSRSVVYLVQTVERKALDSILNEIYVPDTDEYTIVVKEEGEDVDITRSLLVYHT